MKSRWIFIWLGVLLMQPYMAADCMAGASTPISVSPKELDQYWIVSEEDTPPILPPLLRATFDLVKKHRRIEVDYEITINEKGVPVDFKFKSITPANVDPRPFIAWAMFWRYRPTALNSARRPVRVHGPFSHYLPKE